MGSSRQPSEDELASRVRVAVTRLNRRLRQESLGGISPAQATALGSIRRLGNPTLGELAIAEQVRPPTITRIVAVLEGEGLVTRTLDPVDRRVTRVQLSAEGRRAIERIRTLKTAFLARRFDELGPDRAAAAAPLVDLLEALVGER